MKLTETMLLKKQISLFLCLPAHLHIEIAKDCISYKKHLVTASYISPAMQELDDEAKEK